MHWGALASETMWQLAGLVPGSAIVKSWWFAPRERHTIHPAGQSSFGPWAEWMDHPQPLGLATVVSVPTDSGVDVSALAAVLGDRLADKAKGRGGRDHE
ncbi:hypothetical protein [Arthrobacter sp. STN4]|uniref:hypothetical protein n=1 Tax=Arthrobacter sp. STN4 TaxID=2923276 RepID=UPI00211A939F|nr:hypothetical protein [Arthrobacter sp. STN4]MCQ9165813.1 hypothetical protein [Arthrobacter sp. STN4]